MSNTQVNGKLKLSNCVHYWFKKPVFSSSCEYKILGYIYAFQFMSIMFQVGDGTTSVILLAVEFLRQIKSLVEENVHPQILIKGFRKATKLVSSVIFEFTSAPWP